MDYFLGKIIEMHVTGNHRERLVLMNYAVIVFCSIGNKLFVRNHKIKLTAKNIPIVLGNCVYKIYCKSAHK